MIGTPSFLRLLSTIHIHSELTCLIAYVPASNGHYVENTGNTTLKFLEIFNTDKFEDISLAQVRPLFRVDR